MAELPDDVREVRERPLLSGRVEFAGADGNGVKVRFGASLEKPMTLHEALSVIAAVIAQADDTPNEPPRTNRAPMTLDEFCAAPALGEDTAHG